MTTGIYTTKQTADLLGCVEETIAQQIERGDLPGIKIGRGWIVPEAALIQRLNERALQEAAERRKARDAGAAAGKVIAAAQATPGKQRKQARTPPVLPVP